MTPERWQRVKELFEAARARPAESRSRFLDEACVREPDLRPHVESLLAAEERASGFMEEPAWAGGDLAPAPENEPEPFRLRPGDPLGPYQVTAFIGAGGMGEVYRARDVRLARDVALKVLPSHLAQDPAALARFEREARAVAALSHPNILALYDVEIEGEVPYAVMELLEGETLRARLAGGRPLPRGKALEIGAAIAEGLAAAHDRGIVHRDLKPDNVFLTADGGVKVLDFGVALLRHEEAAPAARTARTGTGLVLGTLDYMAPEQARSEAVDGRTDIFALGCVLFEMLTGRRPFARPTAPDTLAAVLHEDPFEGDAPNVPPALLQLLRRCLEKRPQERFQSARDLAFALRAVATGTAAVGAASRPRHLLPWLAAAIALGAAGWLLGRAGGERPAVPANPRPVVVLMDSPLPGRVYDARTLAAGGTNADDITDALGALPVTLHKENTSAMWHREEQVLQQNPDLIVSHLSCLLDARMGQGVPEAEEHLFDLAQRRLVLFFGYVAAAHPRTRFLVYSRSVFEDPAAAEQWLRDAEARYPPLRGRLHTFDVPGTRANATFRDPRTAELIRERVAQILGVR